MLRFDEYVLKKEEEMVNVKQNLKIFLVFLFLISKRLFNISKIYFTKKRNVLIDEWNVPFPY